MRPTFFYVGYIICFHADFFYRHERLQAVLSNQANLYHMWAVGRSSPIMHNSPEMVAIILALTNFKWHSQPVGLKTGMWYNSGSSYLKFLMVFISSPMFGFVEHVMLLDRSSYSDWQSEKDNLLNYPKPHAILFSGHKFMSWTNLGGTSLEAAGPTALCDDP